MNRLIISGNICNELEVKESGETKILNFTVAVKRKFKDKEGNYPTDFIRCVAFNKSSEFIKSYFAKGSPILVEGNLQSNTYEKDGEKRTTYNLVVENVDFFGGKKDNTTQNDSQPWTPEQGNSSFDVNSIPSISQQDDLPF